MLREYYSSSPNEICLNCAFYFRHFRRYLLPNVLKAYELSADSYRYGQKVCVKNKEFVYFNDVCPHFVRTESMPSRCAPQCPALAGTRRGLIG